MVSTLDRARTVHLSPHCTRTVLVEALKASGKKDHLRVDVTGDVQGDTLKVTSIKLL